MKSMYLVKLIVQEKFRKGEYNFEYIEVYAKDKFEANDMAINLSKTSSPNDCSVSVYSTFKQV